MKHRTTPNDPASKADALAMRRVGIFREAMNRITSLEESLTGLEQWGPSESLLAEVQWCRERAQELEERIEEKLLVALVGPSGAGKSTLLNALAGAKISESGMNRPTTTAVYAYTQEISDVEDLERHVGPGQVHVKLAQEAPWLDQIVLVDTPDTNTTPENKELLLRVLEKADVILAVFNAQNPKIHDNIAFLRPIIAEYDQESVIPILGWVDRIEHTQLQEEVIPDFRRHLASEWDWKGKDWFAVSAAASLPDPSFPIGEAPLHDFNEFEKLRDFLLAQMGHAGVRVDLRVSRAIALARLADQRTQEVLQDTQTHRTTAEAAVADFDHSVIRRLADGISAGDVVRSKSLAAVLYEELSQRWWGPTGWLIAIWSRLLSAQRWTSGLLKESPPRLSLLPSQRMLALPAGGGEEGGVPAPSNDLSNAKALLRDLQNEQWPTVSERLLKAGFESKVRRWDVASGITQRTLEALHEEWQRTHADQTDRIARRLSNPMLQLVVNFPSVFILGWIVLQTVLTFFLGAYLPAEYFRHAIVTFLLVWGLSFALFQFWFNLFTGDRFLQTVQRRFRESEHLDIPTTPWRGDLQRLRSLETKVEKHLAKDPSSSSGR